MAKFNPTDHLMKLKGKDYLPVAWRLVWFREQHPNGIIDTEPLQLTDTYAVFQATVTAVGEDGTVLGRATGTKAQSKQGFADFIEKAETGAIGRALAALGFGTQFDPELEEGERLADSPVERPNAPQKATQPPATPTPINANGNGKAASEAAFKRIYAILAALGLEHRHLHAYAVAAGHESSKELTTDELKKLADGLKEKASAAVTYLTKLADDLELKQVTADLNVNVKSNAKGQK